MNRAPALATPPTAAFPRKRKLRERVQPYLDPPIAARLRAYCAATATTESAVVQAALVQYLDRTSDTTLLLRRLDQLARAGARTQKDLELLTETVAVYVKLWFAHTPSVAEDAKPHARTSAEARFHQFVAHVTERLSAGRRFAGDLAHEPVADAHGAELAAAASHPSEPAHASPDRAI